MPHWIEMLAAALGAWFLLVVVGGYAVGRFFDAVSRRLRRFKLHL